MRIEHINENFISSDLNYAIIVFISSDFIMCTDEFVIYIKKKFNSIKDLKKQKKNIGNVAHIFKNNQHIFYVIISDSIENKILQINIQKCIHKLSELIILYNIKHLMTSELHLEKVSANYDKILDYMNEIMPNDIDLYLLL
jgi:hypothetical protein